MTLPNIQGIILIDTWHDNKLNDFYRGIVKHTAKFDIKCCVNSCYNLDLQVLGKDTPDRSFYNTFRCHFWNRGFETQLSDAAHVHPSDRLIANVVRYSRSDFQTSEILATADLLGSAASVVILDPDDFLHHCQMYHNNSIRDWLVVGQAWRYCLHWRPMGFHALAKIAQSQKLNFYVAPWGLLDHNYDSVTDQCFDGVDGISWEPVAGFGYRLAGEFI